jgi:pyruvate,water dikinase
MPAPTGTTTMMPPPIIGGATSEPPIVRPLASLSSADVAFAGELAVRLAGDARAGLRAPGGFVIGTPAFATLCHARFLLRRLVVTLADVCVEDPGRLMAAAAAARSLVMCEPLPRTVQTAIEAACIPLVRDDPTATVTVAASSAEHGLPPLALGPCDRFERLRGLGPVTHAVRCCWSSAFDGRRVYERAMRGLPAVTEEIAVVVFADHDEVHGGDRRRLGRRRGPR